MTPVADVGRVKPVAVTSDESYQPDPAERFEIRGKLGAGGLGVVYRAFDRQRGTEVALKTLRTVTGPDLYRFKREFRLLADVAHPNLATLHELHTVGDEWFLTMELIEGGSFIDWVRPSGSDPLDDPYGQTNRSDGSPSMKAPSGPRQRIIAAQPRFDRLETSLYQLVDTVHALHQAGKLHRDLKPSNVLVENDGRVVVLDFGLVSDMNAATPDRTHETSAVGTPAYMSPEQAADRDLTPASDWYSVGVILYEALTGRRPFDVGGGDDAASSEAALLPPCRFDAAVPEPLDRLCMDLLHPDPGARPDGAAILARLGREASPASVELVKSLAPPPFVGRAAELATLRGALAQAAAGACVAVFVRGASGMGKSSLLRQFLDEEEVQAGTVVLKGRCYERESVPYKTLDAIVDALAAHLVHLPAVTVDAMMPRDIASLARLFPVLRRVPAISDPALRGFQPPEPLELRRRAFVALRELLAQLGRRRTVVLAIDDVQWGDADSGSFFAELLQQQRDAPQVMLVFCHRSEDEDVTPLLAALRRARASAAGTGGASVPVHDVTLGPLAEGEARQLVEAVSGASAGAVGEMVRDSGGSPMFLSELARRGAGPDADGAGAEVHSLEQVLAARIDKLPEEARALLTVCAAAAQPLRSHLALRAAGLAGEGSLVATLCSERLLRVRHPGKGAAELETYHDRIRATVVGRLGAEARRQVHRALAEALESVPEHARDQESLVAHFTEAGELAQAARCAAPAARAAEERLAFHRASALYKVAIDHGHHDELHRRAMRTRLGMSLAYAGRLDESAAVFALAAEGAPAAEQLELRRLELEQLLRGGRLTEGLARSRDVLAAIGYGLPGSQAGAFASLLWQRTLVKLRGLEVKERAASELPPGALQRIDVLWSVASGLSFVDPIYGKVLQTRHLREALACGEPRHVGMALALELGYLATGGGRNAARLEPLRARAIAIGERIGDRPLLGLAKAVGGLSSFLCGDWRLGFARLCEAEQIMRDESTSIRWELDLLEFFVVSAAWYLGDTAEMIRRVPAYVREAEERGDVYALRGHRGWRANLMWLVLDQPDEARAMSNSVALPRGGAHPTQLTHYYELLANTQIDLYLGNARSAYERVERTWRDLKRAMLLRIQNVAIESWYLRARACLALAATGAADLAERRALLRQAAYAARQIEAEAMAWGAPLAALVRATIAHVGGDAQRAVAGLRSAAAGFAAADMYLFATVTNRRLAALVAGSEGAALDEASGAFFRSQGIVDPDAMTRMLAPGW
jgi:hypothetical protein